jgi:hypothetical protein
MVNVVQLAGHRAEDSSINKGGRMLRLAMSVLFCCDAMSISQENRALSQQERTAGQSCGVLCRPWDKEALGQSEISA